MNKKFRVLGLITIIAVIGFSLVTCKSPDDPVNPIDPSNPINGTLKVEGRAAYDGYYYYFQNTSDFDVSLSLSSDNGIFTQTLNNVNASYSWQTNYHYYSDDKFITITYTPQDKVNCETNDNNKGAVYFNNKDFINSWTVVANSTFGNTTICDIAYGDGKFVAVGIGGDIAYSSDGINWTAVTNNQINYNGYYPSIAYGNGKFVASCGNRIAYSTNGVIWTEVTGHPFNGNYVEKITFANDKFFAGGKSGGYDAVYYSSDGNTWTWVGSNIYSIAYGNGKFVAATYYINYEGYYNHIMNSTDGLNWNNVTNTTFITSGISDIIYGNDKFVAIGSGTAYSSDGMTWTAITDNAFNKDSGINAIAYGNGKFVAVAPSGKIAYWSGDENSSYVPPSVAIPSAPTGLTASATSSSQIKISWNEVTGATGYDIYYKMGTSEYALGGKYDTVTWTSGYVNNLLDNYTYYFSVKAVNSAGSSDSSSTVSAKTLPYSSGGGSTGGSSSASGGGGESGKTPCTYCDPPGSGKCPYCRFAGYDSCYCGGKKNCVVCGGTNQRDCIICLRTNKCSICNGHGYK